MAQPAETGNEGSRQPFPDWSGRIVVVAASGPSQSAEDLAEARGKAVILTINDTWKLAPWADALYACDFRWWVFNNPGDGFAGLRFQGHVDDGLSKGCIPCNVKPGDHAMRFCGHRLGSGGNSGFQAVNLAAVSGARRIVLTGFDMSLANGTHWHGDHNGLLGNPGAKMLRTCAEILDRAANTLSGRGIEVLNASRESALTAYRRVTMKEALRD